MQSLRQQKIARQLQKDISEILQSEGKTLFGTSLLSVTVVRVSADLSIARVYLSIFGSSYKKDIINEINLKKALIRKKLGLRIKNQFRKVPELKFFIDDSVEYAEKINNLLKR